MPYEISEQAKADMLHMYIDGAQKHSVDRAESYYAGLIRQFEILALNPRLYHERTEITPPVRIFPYGVHNIIYTVRDNDTVFITRVRHGREDWQSDSE
ncbi:MAG: type II toxin-antitoxin system RelE/ParE family toxin [Robiginitomaculum sp.]|nr:type II toxin-antitoxin system RelE/ParE family toxin [Robiginitomaculum sp.]